MQNKKPKFYTLCDYSIENYPDSDMEGAQVVVTPDPERTKLARLVQLFNQLFQHSYNTRLEYGGDEPLYLPACQHVPYHRILFARGFFNSALHEMAHWCIAGKERRLLEDYGYWYRPDGRTLAEQAEFEQVEAKPQALEWVFAHCCDSRFQVSVDNLSLQAAGQSINLASFKEQVHQQVLWRLERGMTERVLALTAAMIDAFNPGLVLSQQQFRLQDL